ALSVCLSAGESVRLTVIRGDDGQLGFSVRGGSEHGLGVFISRVQKNSAAGRLDPGGLAEQGGVKMGDQILSANGVSFENINHYRAVEVLKSQPHIILTIKEAGRYPAYKEMVTELSWVNKTGSGTVYSSSQGSESRSSTSSLSSGTPLGSVSRLSQATLPLGAKMSDVCGSTEAQFRPDSTDSDSRSEQLRTVSRGPTELLQDSVIRSEGELGERRREGRKTSLLMALSRPSPPIRRTQSHVTVSEEEKKQKRKQTERGEEGSSPLQRSKTFFSLFRKRDSSRSRSESSLGRYDAGLSERDALKQVRAMAVRLLEDEDVVMLMEICERYLAERGLPTLVHPLLAVLNTPEKLLLLREISVQLLSKDLHGGFELHAAEDLERQNQLLEDLEQLRLSCGQDQNESRAFSPLLDVPYGHSDSLTSSRTSVLLPNWLLTENTRPDSGQTLEDALSRRNGHSERRADVLFTVVDAPRHKRPLLSQVFASLKKSHSSTVSPAVESVCEKHTREEFELTTVHISKTKQSLDVS
ncbi:harmonin, partial [Sinocyclocheilus grahami]|uniref:harmonin n=1 Tax=Sinocyclocheilus grahami TaxID=75366 RepID=UPI0007ACEEDA